jgi:hypothetical protein
LFFIVTFAPSLEKPVTYSHQILLKHTSEANINHMMVVLINTGVSSTQTGVSAIHVNMNDSVEEHRCMTSLTPAHLSSFWQRLQNNHQRVAD